SFHLSLRESSADILNKHLAFGTWHLPGQAWRGELGNHGRNFKGHGLAVPGLTEKACLKSLRVWFPRPFHHRDPHHRRRACRRPYEWIHHVVRGRTAGLAPAVD